MQPLEFESFPASEYFPLIFPTLILLTVDRSESKGLFQRRFRNKNSHGQKEMSASFDVQWGTSSSTVLLTRTKAGKKTTRFFGLDLFLETTVALLLRCFLKHTPKKHKARPFSVPSATTVLPWNRPSAHCQIGNRINPRDTSWSFCSFGHLQWKRFGLQHFKIVVQDLDLGTIIFEGWLFPFF